MERRGIVEFCRRAALVCAARVARRGHGRDQRRMEYMHYAGGGREGRHVRWGGGRPGRLATAEEEGTGRLVNPRRSTSSPCRRTRPCRTSIMHTLPAVRSAPCRASERRARPPCRAIHKSAVIYHGVTFRRPYTCIALPPLCFRNALHFILESYSATYLLNFLPYAHEYLHVN